MNFFNYLYLFHDKVSMQIRKYVIFLVILCVFYKIKVSAVSLKKAQNKNLLSNVFPTKCFAHIGCFNSGPPFFDPLKRPISLLPQDDLEMNYLLYVPGSGYNFYNLTLTNKSISESPYNSSLPTMILIPGFGTDYKPGEDSGVNMFSIKDELLIYYAYNVVIIDWTRSNNFPYEQAIANGRKVGALVAYLLELIKEIKGLDYDMVHMVGHSLGAHVAGWAGERINKTGRITGLDPAGPYFYDSPHAVRLDTTDAKFVDIIHTNGADSILVGNGLYQAIGDIDFYPNGGTSQPECERKYSFLQFLQRRQCDHSISMEYFKASIHHCRFPSFLCQSYDEFKDGKCTGNNSTVDDMGLHAKPIPGLKKEATFYLTTTSRYPYCNTNNTLTT